MERPIRNLVTAFGVGALAYLGMMEFLPYPGSFLIKAFPIWCLAILAWREVPGLTGKLLTLGMLLSSVGDIALTMRTELAFMVGLGFFLFAHTTYIIAFSRKVRYVHRRLPYFSLVVAFGVGMAILLAPHLGAMGVPVFAYLTVITTMVVFAGLRADVSPLLMVAAVVFMSSDAMIAIGKFLTPFPGAKYGIMVTYYIAQFLIVWAFLAGNKTPSADRFGK
jgi:alkenylglycerophosphocholine hydrolase